MKVSDPRNKSSLCCNDLDICQTIQMVAMVAHPLRRIWNINILFCRITEMQSVAQVRTLHRTSRKRSVKFSVQWIFLIFLPFRHLIPLSSCISFTSTSTLTNRRATLFKTFHHQFKSTSKCFWMLAALPKSNIHPCYMSHPFNPP